MAAELPPRQPEISLDVTKCTQEGKSPFKKCLKKKKNHLFLDMGGIYTAVYVYENAVSCTYMIYTIFCCEYYVSTGSF